MMQGLYFIGFLLDAGFFFIFHFWRTYFLVSGIISLVITIPLSALLIEPPVYRTAGRRLIISGTLAYYTVALTLIALNAFMLSLPLLSFVPIMFQERSNPYYYVFLFAMLGLLGFTLAGYLFDRLGKWQVTLYFSSLELISGILLFAVAGNLYILAVLVPAYISAGFFGFIGVWASHTYPEEIRASATNIVFLVGRVLGGFSPFIASIISYSLKDGISLVMIIATNLSIAGSMIYLFVSRSAANQGNGAAGK